MKTRTGVVKPMELDVREVLARGETPCGPIEDAVARLEPGQALILLAPFEPVPLYTKLGLCGFAHETTRLEDGTWRIRFEPGATVAKSRFAPCAPGGRH